MSRPRASHHGAAPLKYQEPDYVELLIRQTHTPQGKSLTDRPVFHIIVQGT